MQWFISLQKSHPASHYTKTFTKTNSKQSDDKKYKLIKSSNSSKTSKAASITKPCNSQIEMKKAFTTLNYRIEGMDNEDSDFTNLDDDDDEKSHF